MEQAIDATVLLRAIAVVLAVAALTTVVFQRLRQPVVLGYVLAGLIVGPHLPIPLVADPGVVHTLSELGVVLLMFSLGLDFSLRKLIRVGTTAGITAVVQSSLMVWLGFVVGRSFGWTTLESIFAGAIIAISSTTIIAKAFDEEGVRGKLREVVVGVLIVEDLIAILLMAVLTALASSSGLTLGPLLVVLGKLAAFLLVVMAIGLLVVPRAVRAVRRLDRRETTLVASIGFCFGVALLAHAAGYSVALGAFLAGSLIAESGEERAIEHLVEPVRDLFAAIFFVSVGMSIDPALVATHAPAVLTLTAVVIAGKIVGVVLGSFLTGLGVRTSVQAGMSLAQIGEFSFIIAGLGLALGATRPFLYPVAVAVSAITTLTTPWLIRFSGPVASWVDRRLPHRLQTFATLYASWVEQLRAARPAATTGAAIRRYVRLLGVDAALLAGLVVGTAAALPHAARLVQERLGTPEELAMTLVVAGAGALAAPLIVGLLRVSQGLGVALAEAALPLPAGTRLDLAAAPRRTLVVTLQLGCVLLVGIVLVAVTQPFLPGLPGALIFVAALAVLGLAFWRSAENLQGHVRAGAQVIAEALLAGTAETRVAATAGGRAAAAPALAPAEPAQLAVDRLVPGLGTLLAVKLEPTSAAVGRTLAELDVRSVTGATVLAITRDGSGVLVPTATERLRAGDVLGVVGTQEAITAAERLLLGRMRR